jgi:hypothetical protein
MGMELKAIKGDSVEIVVIPQRGETGHKHRPAYLFRQLNPKPEATDERELQGAAWLETERDGCLMKGRYWMNRSWHRGLNTAGLVTFCSAARD